MLYIQDHISIHMGNGCISRHLAYGFDCRRFFKLITHAQIQRGGGAGVLAIMARQRNVRWRADDGLLIVVY